MKFIIYSQRYNPNSGGIIALHLLCHTLNTLGYQAYLWQNYRPLPYSKKSFKNIMKILKYYRKEIHKKYAVNENWQTPIAKFKDLKDSIVVYSEIVQGNPLNATNVVRWLLHKPGFHNGIIDFKPNELLFGYGKEFSGSGYEIDDNHTLVLKYIMTDIYKNTNSNERSGSCHMIRKGKNKPFIHDENSLLVDGLSHRELNDIFNKKKYFISYDPYTYYSTYAALCGCISIVIPDNSVSKEEWHPKIENRYGLAYGIDDVEYALTTKELLNKYMQEQEEVNILSVKNFIFICSKEL